MKSTLRIGLSTLLLCGVQAATAAPPPKLTEAAVVAFMAEVSAASQARDVERIGRLMAPECVVVFNSSDRRDQVASQLDRTAYLARLREGYSSLTDVKDYRYQTSNLRVQLAADAKQAIVDADVTEQLSFNDRNVVTHSHEASVVELRDGRPQLVKVAGTVSGTSL